VINRSSQRFRRRAERTPAGIEISSANSNDTAVSSKVAGYLWRISSPTFLSKLMDFPNRPERFHASSAGTAHLMGDLSHMRGVRPSRSALRRAFAEHGLNGIAGNEMDQKKDGRYHHQMTGRV